MTTRRRSPSQTDLIMIMIEDLHQETITIEQILHLNQQKEGHLLGTIMAEIIIDELPL